jgi:hypothetical protein
MKLYLALNEAGTAGDIALHTKVLVLSVLANTHLRPVLLYTGRRNLFTEWLEAHGVRIIDSKVPYIDTIDALVMKGRYSNATLGHWLRTNVCLEEKDDEFVLYTDVDVFFRKEPDLLEIRPSYCAAAPEFDKNSWNYFNAGVMVINVPGLREEYPAFESYLRKNLEEKTFSFHDEIAYNVFYRGRWARLPPELNWKPYWGKNDAACIVHFHGPKIGAIEAICDGRWDWSTGHGRQIGSILATNLDAYEYYLRDMVAQAPGLGTEDRDRIEFAAKRVGTYDAILNGEINTSFMNFRMFNDDH